MSAKVKLVSCIFGLIITIGMLVVGVLAATQSDFLFQGNVTFAVADKSLYVRNVRYQHGMNTPQNVPGFRQGFINGGFDLNMSNVDFGDNTTGTFVLYFDIINFVVGGTTHEYIASASWTSSAVSGVSFSIDSGSEVISKGTVTPENLTDSTPISGSVALEIFVNNTTNFDLSNITVSFSQSVNLDETDYVLNDEGGITINDYSGNASNIVIPDSYMVGGMTYPVTSVGGSTFANNTDIQTVTLPETITSIGSSAFINCSNLTTINLPDGLTEIGYAAFNSCTKLAEIVLPNTLTKIGENAFFNCVLISGTLNIPASVTTIEQGGLTLQGLTEFIVDPGNDYFTAYNGVLYSKDMTRLLAYPTKKATTNFVVPDTVLTIDNYAFRFCTGLRGTFTLSPILTTIGNGVFYNCTNLTGELTIPASAANITEGTFAGCRFTAFVVEEGNPSYTAVDGVWYDKDVTKLLQYPAGKTQENFVIPSTVIEIGASAIQGCVNLTGTITLPANLQTIGTGAINNCTNLTGGLVIPQTVTSIGGHPFYSSTFTSFSIDNDYYTTLGGVLYDADMTTLMQYPTGKPDTSFTVPSGVVTIDSYTFRGNKSLNEITIPSSVTSIGENAFSGCSNLDIVIIDSQAVAAMLSSRIGANYLVRYAKTVYVEESAAASLPAEFDTIFVETTSDKIGYKKYSVL